MPPSPPSFSPRSPEARFARHEAELSARFLELENEFMAYQERPSGGLRLNVSLKADSLALDAAMYGHVALSERTLDFKEAFEALPKNNATRGRAKRGRLHELLLRVRQALEVQGSAVNRALRRPRPSLPPRDDTLLFVFEIHNEICTKDQKAHLESFGFKVQCFDSVRGLSEAVAKRRPVAVVADFDDLERDEAAFFRLVRALPGEKGDIPVLVFGGGNDVRSRLRALRAGSSGYSTEPFAPDTLLERLDSLGMERGEEAYRVLIVDHSAREASLRARVLERYGFSVTVVTDPFEVMQFLSEFNPDLLLIDLYMPGCTGVELAGVIRQKREFESIPIVFLSVEEDVVRKLAAVSAAGDDFLTKTMDPAHMAESLRSRAVRSRRLKSFMVRDGLTGLYNHTTIKLYLEREVSWASRRKDRFAFAMLDLDRFKAVNDAYGHPTGDMVLRSLSKTLRQRMRKSDILGRYGGEEFAVILTDVVDENAALRAMEDIRETFGRIVHRHEDQTFHVTLSCGVAMYPEFTTAEELAEASDKALYQAKDLGRNRVVKAKAE